MINRFWECHLIPPKWDDEFLIEEHTFCKTFQEKKKVMIQIHPDVQEISSRRG